MNRRAPKLFFWLLAGAALVGVLALLPTSRSLPVVEARSLLQATNPVTPTKTPAPTATPVKVGGKIAAEKSCYVRLPDLPAARYGMFGAYNPTTGVLVAGGGAQKVSEENTLAFYQLYAIKLNSPQAKWAEVPYGQLEGYTREYDKGCREGASVQVSDSLWLSVLGKDGCDHGRFDPSAKKGGDVPALAIGDTADAGGVRWVENSGAVALVDQLISRRGVLARLFATWDTHRERLIFGQGSFNDKRETEGQDEVYAGLPVGRKIQLMKLDPQGPIPERRFGTCAAFIYDEATKVNGVLVLGGKEGGPTGTRDLNEVWWLDFSESFDGTWKNITGRFGNQKDIDYRWESACGFDPETRHFYTYMGRAKSSIKDGASHSGGIWRVKLDQLGDPAATFTWERLAKDNLGGLKGRRGIPSVFDRIQKRFFVIGGRNGLVAYKDVWAIYPDVTGEACQALDPFAPPPGQPTATPEPAPTEIPDGAKLCPQIRMKAPEQLIADALANPAGVPGYDQPADPDRPVGPDNPPRQWLSLDNPGAMYHPLVNRFVFKSGCP